MIDRPAWRGGGHVRHSTDPMAATLPREFEPKRLWRRGAQAVALLAVLGLIVAFMPGLGEVRAHLRGADPWWVAVAVALELLSGVSYVAMFRAVFCPRMGWARSWKIGWSELAAGSIVPASGASGLALGAWILHRQGMSGERIARRSVAFFLIKSSVNFVAVAVLGTLMAVGLLGPAQPAWLTVVPAAASAALIAVVLALPRLGEGRPARPGACRLARAWSATRRSVIGGVGEAVELVRARDGLVIAGSIGYWAFDNAVLWATFEALGDAPPLTVILLGYLIGQVGGLLPIPGGVGGIDGGLIGALVVYGAPAAEATAAVLAYRVILFWLPLIVGGLSFLSLRRDVALWPRREPARP
jgi:uncharacterized membrane protein YbhN (UPF0104 family)